MAVSYDGHVIRKYAQMLYNRANFLIIALLLIGAAGGFIVGLVLQKSLDRDVAEYARMGGTLVGAVLGGAIGASLAFKYKLQAQLAMCQVQIEENTRRVRRSEGNA